MKLERVVKSAKKNKKFTAIFCLCKGKSCCDDSKKKLVNFGSAGMDDYTITKDKEQRNRYRARHKKDLLEKKHAEYYLDYYTNSRWKDVLVKKNKINNNIIDNI